MRKPKTHQTAVGRGLGMGWLGMQLAGGYLGFRFQKLFIGGEQGEEKKRQYQRRATRRLTEGLQNLKGPLMKIGQVLSMQDNLLPREVVDELSALQMSAPAMHPTLARARFKSSFGKYPEEVFKEFEPEPFAAASLGQAHRARTKSGESVVVKIQYPDMASAIQSDFKLLRTAIAAGRLGAHVPKETIDEVERGILSETDYAREAANVEFFREKLRPLTFVYLPKVYPEYSTDRVITLSFVEGIPMGKILELKPSQEARNLLGNRLLRLFLFQIQQVQAFHADPHPGNYLFTPDGRIGLIDFGCVKQFTPELAQLVRCFLSRAWLRDPKEEKRMLRLMWGSDPCQTSPPVLRLLRTEFELLNYVFPPPGAARRLVSFEDRAIFDIGLRMRKVCFESKITHPEFAFYSRAELGLYSYLRQLKAILDTNEILQSMPRPD